MDTIPENSEPRRSRPVPDLLDPGVVVASRDGLARDTDPVHIAVVLESDGHLLIPTEVGELLAVCVGQEQEVRSCTLCNGHRTRDRLGAASVGFTYVRIGGLGTYSNAVPPRTQHAHAEFVGNCGKVIELLVGRCLIVPLLGDGRVLALLNLALIQWLWHVWHRER